MFSRWVANSTIMHSVVRNASSTTLKRSRSVFGGQSSLRYLSYRRQSPTRKRMLEKRASRQATSANSSNANTKIVKPDKNKLMLVGANAMLFFGMSMWLLLFVDKYFKKREKECINKAHEQLYAEFGDLDDMGKQYMDTPALFTCMVRLPSRELKDFFPVEVGDVVDVLVEGVGNDGSLNICRTRPKTPNEKPVVSLYPMGCLQRVVLVEESNHQGDDPSSNNQA